MTAPTLLWFRQDLRLHDQPALAAAVETGAVVPIYILDDEAPGRWRMGEAQRWYLHHALEALGTLLEGKGSRLILRRGRAREALCQLMEETGAERIYAVRHYEPWWREAEEALGDRLQLHDGNHLVPVERLKTASGQPFRIYSSFWRALATHLPPDHPIPAPTAIPSPARWPQSDTLSAWKLRPTAPDWSGGFAVWTAGEEAADTALRAFADQVDDYATARNLPSTAGTSQLSPHLHFGEISPRTVWHALASCGEGASTFHKELAWRDFTDGVVLALPDYGCRNGRPKYNELPWRTGKVASGDLKAWQRGQSGYPIVDAGMRQLWTSGWMHNRVRMIVASFLVKHLLIDWREGERWFWDCLVDADYGNNSVNWQWVAGTGIDSNMFGRIMAPLSQSEKFDAGAYIREWVPELRALDDAAIHDPETAGQRPESYPRKIVGHREGRERALKAAATLR